MDGCRALLLPLALFSCPLAARADPPRVHFDMPYTIACREVTPPGFAEANRGQKLVEARLEISSLLTAGKERDLVQYFVRIESLQRTLSIVDYLPKTIHESRLAAPVQVQATTEKSASLGINLSGKYEPLSAGFSAGIGQKNSSSVKYELLPPLETVAASGTLLRGQAVFFKLQASPRQLLEGSRQYAFVARVPATWRADYIRVRCEAKGIRQGVIDALDEQVTCGQRDFHVALYQEGDEQARQTAEDFARSRGRQVQGPMSKVESQGAANWTLGMPGGELWRR